MQVALLLALSCSGRISGDNPDDDGGDDPDDSTSEDTGPWRPKREPPPDWSVFAESLTDFGGFEQWTDGEPTGVVGFWAYDGAHTQGMWAVLNVARGDVPSNGGAGTFEAEVNEWYGLDKTGAFLMTLWGERGVPLPCEKPQDYLYLLDNFELGSEGALFLTIDGSGHGSMRTEDVMLWGALRTDDFELQDIESPDLTFERCDDLLFFK